MRSVMGCSECAQCNLARHHHSKNDVKVDVRRLKTKHLTALLTVGDMSATYKIVSYKNGDEAKKELEQVQWAEKSPSR